MADKSIKLLPGFRDFTPDNCAVRNYLFAIWRQTAQSYGFVEYEAPMLEPTALYQKKTGEELNTQLFRFEDQGGRDVTLRPELTASLARIVTGHQRNYPKPMKWFEIGSCFRYERQQRGRTREFIQFNADIIGESDPAADAELIALAIDTMLALGFTADDFVIRASDRQSWLNYCTEKNIEDVGGFLAIIDKIEREKPEVLAEKLSKFKLTADEVKGFINNPENASDDFKAIQANLEARGLGAYIKLDLTIVRGLAYYTGTVFEIFDTSHSMRAIAGGGRYDDLLKTLSDGSVDLPCTGFAMGDVVIRNFIEETPHAKAKMDTWLKTQAPCDIFVVIADEEQRPNALKLITELRNQGHKVEYPLTPAKFNKQFKTAEKLGATKAVIIGDEFPELQVNDLSTREKTSIPSFDALLKHL
ncbi:histidine--tRNA ligase [Rubritalea marina]|uniref:histidine--tRNA ligase n=1 Tax=Rubritalea marina TaxID=361055 RepID=UPI00036AD9D8|nr:histidine--tRNA ligase [Rubritalea marina]